jgi:hypothetical protein
MPLTTDAVSRMCIANTKDCNVIYKCEECKKEINDLIQIDNMFVDYFKQLEYLKSRTEKTVKEEIAKIVEDSVKSDSVKSDSVKSDSVKSDS